MGGSHTGLTHCSPVSPSAPPFQHTPRSPSRCSRMMRTTTSSPGPPRYHPGPFPNNCYHPLPLGRVVPTHARVFFLLGDRPPILGGPPSNCGVSHRPTAVGYSQPPSAGGQPPSLGVPPPPCTRTLCGTPSTLRSRVVPRLVPAHHTQGVRRQKRHSSSIRATSFAQSIPMHFFAEGFSPPAKV